MPDYFEFEEKIREKSGEEGLKLRGRILNFIDEYEQAMRMTPFLFRRKNDAVIEKKISMIKKGLTSAIVEAKDIDEYVMPQEISRVKKVLDELGLNTKTERNADGWKKL